MAEYWVYHDRHHDRATAHYGTCGHCRGGRGKNGGSLPAHGRWIGSFSTLEGAWVAAVATHAAVNRCAHCL